MWTFITGFLVFFMQAGSRCVETGFTRSKNVAHTMMMNMMVFCIGALGYWLVGFAFQFGGVNTTFPAIGKIAENSFAPGSLGDLERAPEPLAHRVRSPEGNPGRGRVLS